MHRSLIYFIRLILTQLNLILLMAKRQATSRYVGSFLGFVWTFINPLFMIFIFWVVFGLGFKVRPISDVPFIVWLTAGMAVWFVFAEIVNESSGLILSNANLIKKTLFHSQILPVINIIACLITHAVFLIILMALVLFHQLSLSFYFFQFLYYLFSMCVLALGLSWALAALTPFIRDVGPIVGVLLQMGFWATPIFWDIQIMPPNLQTVFKLNPMFYIVQGYRESFIYFRPFWEHPWQTIYFWTIAGATFLIGAMVFRKLKPQFAEVL